MSTWLVPVRKGENEELRYAIRTWVRNGGLGRHDTLVVVGHQPDWLRNVEFYPGNLLFDTPRNVYANLVIGCSKIIGPVIIVNDDFFFVRRVDPTVATYRGPLADHIAITNANSAWGKSLRTTMKILTWHGYVRPLSYELHRPFPCDSFRMAKTLRNFAKHTPMNPPQWRTLYGNLWTLEGVQAEDGKVYSERDDPGTDVLSTTDNSWTKNRAMKAVTEKFNRKTRFER